MSRYSIAGTSLSFVTVLGACGSTSDSSASPPAVDGGTEDSASGPTDGGGAIDGPATPGTPTAVAVATGSSHTCAMAPSGAVKCWGMNIVGQAANPSTTGDYTIETPSEVTSLTGQTAAFSAGEGWSCALTRANGVKCWGSHGDFLPLQFREDADVLLHAREGRVKRLGEVRDRCVATCELLQHATSDGVRERRERRIELGSRILNHTAQHAPQGRAARKHAGGPSAIEPPTIVSYPPPFDRRALLPCDRRAPQA